MRLEATIPDQRANAAVALADELGLSLSSANAYLACAECDRRRLPDERFGAVPSRRFPSSTCRPNSAATASSLVSVGLAAPLSRSETSA